MTEEEYHFTQEEEFINKTSKENKMSNTELIVIKDLKPDVFEDEQEITNLVESVRSAVSNDGLDMNLKKDRKLLASLAMKVAKSKTSLDEIGKKYVAGVKAKIKKIDKIRAYARNELDDIKLNLRQPLTDWEAIEKERVSNLESLIVHIKEKKRFYKENPLSETQEDIACYIETLEGLFHHEWQEYLHDATNAIKEAYEHAEKALEQRKQFDNDQKELQELRELQAKQRQEAEELKLKERLEAEIKAKLKREEEQELAKVQSDDHKLKIELSIISALVETCGVCEDFSCSIVNAIAKGKIKNLKIYY